MLSVDEALSRILDRVTVLGQTETVSLDLAAGRVLAQSLCAKLTQPPFDASAMDGYAVRRSCVSNLPATLKVVGEAAAGHGFTGSVEAGQAVRIFTGAPVPSGADAIVIQENTKRDGDTLTVCEGLPDGAHVRPAGGDFRDGQELIAAGTRLGARSVLLAAAMGHGEVQVIRRPKVAILSTGDELVAPGEMPGPDQIVASNAYGIAAMVEAFGAEPLILGIAKDTAESLEAKIAQAGGADILVTIGGASVGDHDLVSSTLQAKGMALDFWKIAMRPGKPLLFGRLDGLRVIGVPGNPVSSMICARVFVVPLVLAMLGAKGETSQIRQAVLGSPLEKNGPRHHFMRGRFEVDDDGRDVVVGAENQDSSLIGVLARANCLIVREAHATAAEAGELVRVLSLDF